MQLISLNIWGGKVFEPLMRFVAAQAASTDVFCLQEVTHTTSEKTAHDGHRMNMFAELQRVLPQHVGFHAPMQAGQSMEGAVDFHLEVGLATFVRRNIEVTEHGDEFVYLYRNAMQHDFTTIGRNVEFTSFSQSGNDYTICNFHGLWNGGEKTDAPERIEQSRKLLQILDRFRGRKLVLCGDFNLLPTTESLRMLERGMRNLIKESGVTSTRSSYYKHPEWPRFAVYALVSPEVTVQHFAVLKDEVSDHLPLLLDFE
ncbi:MAG: endonuclease/exonuclease/phosphatase family protein [Candidatus Andersenbacteria bacterium]